MGHWMKIKFVDSRVNVHILASTSVPFTLTTEQMPNLALTHTKRITVYGAGRNDFDADKSISRAIERGGP
jgi:hypothetical protein